MAGSLRVEVHHFSGWSFRDEDPRTACLSARSGPPPPLRGSRPPSTTQMNHSPRSDPSRAYRPNPTPIAPVPSCSRRPNLDGGTKGQQPCKCQSEQAGQNPKYDRPHPRGRPGRMSGGDGAILSVAFASPPTHIEPRGLSTKGNFGAQSHGIGTHCPRVVVRLATHHARLASGSF